MRTGIEQARIDLAKWQAYVANDADALAQAESQAQDARDRLANSTRVLNSLQHAVNQWDAMEARLQQPNTEIGGASPPHLPS